MVKKPAFKYRERDATSVKRRATQQGGAFDSYTLPHISVFKPDAGDHNIRILPLPPTHDFDTFGEHWGIEVFVHNSVGPDNSTYLCLSKMKGERCPVCDMRKELLDDGDENAASEIKAGKRVLAWIIDRDNEGDGPKLWALPWTVDREIAARSFHKKTNEIILVDHPEEGYDISFTREGAGLKTKYIGVEISREATPIAEDEDKQDEWLAYIEENPLQDCLNYFDEDYLKAILHGKKPKGKKTEEDDAEEKPARSSSKRSARDEDADERKSRRSAKEEPVDEEDDQHETRRDRAREDAPKRRASKDVDDDEAEEKPARSSSKRSARDEDAEEDADADDESEASAKKAISGLKSRRERA